MDSKIDILGVKIDLIKKEQVLNLIKTTIDYHKKAQIVTVNPEFVIEAQTNQKFKECLNQASLSVADGVGIKAAGKFLSLKNTSNPIIRPIQALCQGLCLIGPKVIFNKQALDIVPEIITGSDLIFDLAKLSQDNSYSIFLLGAMPGVAKLAGEKLKKRYPDLKIAGSYAGSPKKEEEQEIIKTINQANPDILLVAYGAPKQDLWIKRNIDKINPPIVAIGVGGTFDFVAGYSDLKNKKTISRAPKFYQKLGLEWLYRLIQNPKKRAGRIWNASVVFPWLVWKESWQRKKTS